MSEESRKLMFVVGVKGEDLDGIPVALFTDMTSPMSKKSGNVSCIMYIARPVLISHSWSGIPGNDEGSSELGDASGGRCVRKPKSEIGREARLVDSERGAARCWEKDLVMVRFLLAE